MFSRFRFRRGKARERVISKSSKKRVRVERKSYRKERGLIIRINYKIRVGELSRKIKN